MSVGWAGWCTSFGFLEKGVWRDNLKGYVKDRLFVVRSGMYF